jgi:hypothetical protein
MREILNVSNQKRYDSFNYRRIAMQTWTIEGADKGTGKGRKVQIKAQDEQEAQHIANLQGILVSRVYIFVPSDPLPAAPTPDELRSAADSRTSQSPGRVRCRGYHRRSSPLKPQR